MVAHEAVQAALARICASRSLTRAEQQTRLLRYVVDKALAGQAAEIKEYAIAVDVFGRATYDPRVDSLVRVEVAKLRERLARYYETDGREDPVRIEIPKGGYAPAFRQTAQPVRAARRHFPLRLAAGVLALGLAAVAVWRWTATRQPPQTAGAPSIAVLPFADMSPAKDRDYFCDGLTEELIHALAGLEGLRVASRTSTFQYKGRTADLRSIGQALNVQAVLEGSVRVEGDRIRVAVQLINARDGFHLWTDTYDRELGDALEIQREIATGIAKSFRLDLTGTRRALVRPHSRNPDAYHYYLRAAHLSGIVADLESVTKSVEYYKASVSADSNYALAWAGLSRTWTVLVDWGFARATEILPTASEAARRAVALDGRLAEAQQALGRVRVFYEHDWPGAEEAFRRAMELDPTHVDARHDYARLILNSHGRFSEATDQLRRAIALDPTNISLLNELANTYIKARQFDNAVEHLNMSQKFSPRGVASTVMLGIVAMGKGDYRQALERYEKAATAVRSSWVLGHLGCALAKLGRRVDAAKVIAELNSATPEPNYEIAVIHAALGDKDRAFAHLERAHAAFAGALIWSKVDFRLDDLRPDPRVRALLKKMRLE